MTFCWMRIASPASGQPLARHAVFPKIFFSALSRFETLTYIIAKAEAPWGRTEIAMKYLFLDLETPNRRNDRISQIAVILSDEEKILAEYNWLVNPEASFERFNINLTGLDPQECYAAPIFPEIWAKLLPLIVEADAIVGHNVTFDLSVIRKCLEY